MAKILKKKFNCPFEFDQTDEVEKNLSEQWVILDVLGRGGFSLVVAMFSKKFGITRAFKILEKEKFSGATINQQKEEPAIQTQCKHPNIITLHEVFESKKRILMILEYCQGVDLYQFIKNRSSQNKQQIDADIRFIVKCILQAVAYLHENNVVHRDIKPGNVLLKSKNSYRQIKLADFGLSLRFESQGLSRFFSHKCGTLIYMAPELVENNMDCSKSVDIWAVGQCMAILCNNANHPFVNKGDTEEKIKKIILSGKLGIDKLNCDPKAKHFMDKLLQVTPSQRYTANEALEHPWITGKEMNTIPMTGPDMMMIYTSSQEFKKIFLLIKFVCYVKNSYANRRLEFMKKNSFLRQDTISKNEISKSKMINNNKDLFNPKEIDKKSNLENTDFSPGNSKNNFEPNMFNGMSQNTMIPNNSQISNNNTNTNKYINPSKKTNHYIFRILSGPNNASISFSENQKSQNSKRLDNSRLGELVGGKIQSNASGCVNVNYSFDTESSKFIPNMEVNKSNKSHLYKKGENKFRNSNYKLLERDEEDGNSSPCWNKLGNKNINPIETDPEYLKIFKSDQQIIKSDQLINVKKKGFFVSKKYRKNSTIEQFLEREKQHEERRKNKSLTYSIYANSKNDDNYDFLKEEKRNYRERLSSIQPDYSKKTNYNILDKSNDQISSPEPIPKNNRPRSLDKINNKCGSTITNFNPKVSKSGKGGFELDLNIISSFDKKKKFKSFQEPEFSEKSPLRNNNYSKGSSKNKNQNLPNISTSITNNFIDRNYSNTNNKTQYTTKSQSSKDYFGGFRNNKYMSNSINASFSFETTLRSSNIMARNAPRNSKEKRALNELNKYGSGTAKK